MTNIIISLVNHNLLEIYQHVISNIYISIVDINTNSYHQFIKKRKFCYVQINIQFDHNLE